MGKALRKALKLEAKRQVLAFQTTPEARKEKLRLASSWTNRCDSPKEYHNPKNMNNSVYKPGNPNVVSL